MSDNIPVKNTFPVEESTGYSWQQRMDAVARYSLLGNMRVISEQLNIPYPTLCEWKRSDWWPEMVDQLRRQRKGKTSEGLIQVVEQSLDIIKDRLDNGDFILNNKTGEVVRKPVSLKDASTIANNLLGRQMQLEEIVEKSKVTQDTVQETLTLIAKELKRHNKIERQSNAETIEFKEI